MTLRLRYRTLKLRALSGLCGGCDRKDEHTRATPRGPPCYYTRGQAMRPFLRRDSIFASRLSIFVAAVSSDLSLRFVSRREVLRFVSSISSRSRLISRERPVISVNFSCSYAAAEMDSKLL
jgi:hypothetical protein